MPVPRPQFLPLVIASLWLFAPVATVAREFTDLGPQVTATTIQGSAFLDGPSGAKFVYTVARGEPAHLLGYALPSGKLVTDLPVPDTDGAWNVTISSDGWLYLPGHHGHVFRYRPGADRLEDLGVALAGESIIWDLSAGANGDVYGATYPGCRVFRYDPHTGFSDVGRGAMVAGENYVRAVAAHPASGRVFAGVGSHAHLMELNPATGAKRELLPAKYRDQEAAYALGIIPDEKDGDRLLVLVTNINETLLYNLRSGVFERTLGSISVKSASRDPQSREVYFSDGAKLCSINLDHPEQPPAPLTRCIGANAMHWRADGQLEVLTRYAQVLTYDPATRRTSSTTLHIPPQPIPIQSIVLGPDGRMWMGGFLAGGTAAFDPATGTTTLYKGLSQTERMAVIGSRIYFGIYPHARLHVYDTTRPWNTLPGGRPLEIARLEGQSRPITAVAVPALNRVFFGTVPEYGHVGGALVDIDAATDAVKVYTHVVRDQSVVSLSYADGMVLGGTSIFGGLGGEPTMPEAKLFGWDPVSARKAFEVVPVPGAHAITCLIVGPDHNLWGVADSELFVFDLAARRVRSRHSLTIAAEKPRWRDAFLVQHPSGQLYGMSGGHFFRLDPRTKRVTVLRSGNLELLAMDRDGRLYFKQATHLWRYDPR